MSQEVYMYGLAHGDLRGWETQSSESLTPFGEKVRDNLWRKLKGDEKPSYPNSEMVRIWTKNISPMGNR